MKVNTVITKDYENVRLCRCGQYKPNSNPIPQRDTQYATCPVDTRYEIQTQSNPISNPSFERFTQMIEIFVLRDVASIGEVKFIKARWKPTRPFLLCKGPGKFGCPHGDSIKFRPTKILLVFWVCGCLLLYFICQHFNWGIAAAAQQVSTNRGAGKC